MVRSIIRLGDPTLKKVRSNFKPLLDASFVPAVVNLEKRSRLGVAANAWLIEVLTHSQEDALIPYGNVSPSPIPIIAGRSKSEDDTRPRSNTR